MSFATDDGEITRHVEAAAARPGEHGEGDLVVVGADVGDGEVRLPPGVYGLGRPVGIQRHRREDRLGEADVGAGRADPSRQCEAEMRTRASSGQA